MNKKESVAFVNNYFDLNMESGDSILAVAFLIKQGFKRYTAIIEDGKLVDIRKERITIEALPRKEAEAVIDVANQLEELGYTSETKDYYLFIFLGDKNVEEKMEEVKRRTNYSESKF